MRPGTIFTCVVDQLQVEPSILKQMPIGPDQGAVPVSRSVRFPGPPTEPDVRRAGMSPLAWWEFGRSKMSLPCPNYSAHCVLVMESS